MALYHVCMRGVYTYIMSSAYYWPVDFYEVNRKLDLSELLEIYPLYDRMERFVA